MIRPDDSDIGRVVIWCRAFMEAADLRGHVVGIERGLIWVQFEGYPKPLGLTGQNLEWDDV